MEDSAAKGKSSGSGRSAPRLLRYPLRSATKSKAEKPPLADASNSSTVKSGRPVSSLSKSVNVLDLSGKDKSAKPPRRLSNAPKLNASPNPRFLGSSTPISESRGNQRTFNTPKSSISSAYKRKNLLSSASYWVSQIKVAESAQKHSISLGFFKLALDAGCEPFQKMRDELKAYLKRHDLPEESVKELLESYTMFKGSEQIDVSGTCSEIHSESDQYVEDDVRSSSSVIIDGEKLKTKSLKKNVDEVCQAQHVIKEESSQKSDSFKNNKKSSTKTTASPQTGPATRGRSNQKKSQKHTKQEKSINTDTMKKKGTKFSQATLDNTQEGKTCPENKENMALEETAQSEG